MEMQSKIRDGDEVHQDKVTKLKLRLIPSPCPTLQSQMLCSPISLGHSIKLFVIFTI